MSDNAFTDSAVAVQGDFDPARGLHILQHSLGVDRFGQGNQYRNHFVTGEGSLDYPDCMALVQAGLMTKQKGGRLTGGDDAFFVTEEGKRYVAAHSPKPPRLTPSQRRYLEWLKVADATCETFFQFCRRSTKPKAPPMHDPANTAGTREGLEGAKLGYADPPYIGCAHLYSDQPDFAGEVDHGALIERLESEFDGWVLHAAATPRSYGIIIPLIEKIGGVRICQWVKPFAAYKRNVPVAYASEPVFIKAARKPVVSKRHISRDWIAESITLRRGLTGAKPEKVCHWAFELLGARPEDDLDDMFPGTGAVMAAWRTWKGLFTLPAAP